MTEAEELERSHRLWHDANVAVILGYMEEWGVTLEEIAEAHRSAGCPKVGVAVKFPSNLENQSVGHGDKVGKRPGLPDRAESPEGGTV